MSEFKPLIPHGKTEAQMKFGPTTSCGYEVVSIHGPDSDGFFAAILKSHSGRLFGTTHDETGKCISDGGNSEYKLTPIKPKTDIYFIAVSMNALNRCVVDSSSSAVFDTANLALVFENGKLVGSKVL